MPILQIPCALLAIVGGVGTSAASYVLSHAPSPIFAADGTPVSSSTATNAIAGGLVLAAGGAAGSILTALIPFWKSFLDYLAQKRESDRLENAERWNRHNLVEHVDALKHQLEAARLDVEEAKGKADAKIAEALAMADQKIAAAKAEADQKIEENRRLIGILSNLHAGPSVAHPDPLGDFRRAKDSGEFPPAKAEDLPRA